MMSAAFSEFMRKAKRALLTTQNMSDSFPESPSKTKISLCSNISYYDLKLSELLIIDSPKFPKNPMSISA